MSRGHLLDDCVRRIRNQVVSAAGSSDARDRHALAAAVERKTVGDPAVPISNPVLDEFADAMVDDPAKGDLDALRMAGFSDDAIFELVLTASTAAGFARLEQAVRALDEANGEANG